MVVTTGRVVEGCDGMSATHFAGPQHDGSSNRPRRDTLRVMVERGNLKKLSRGLYRLIDSQMPTHPDLTAVAVKVPHGVICLISALAYYERTTQIPHEVYLAIDRNSEPPRIDFPSVRTFRFSGAAFTQIGNRVDSIRMYC